MTVRLQHPRRRAFVDLQTVVGVAIGVFEIVETLTMSFHFWLHTIGLESGPFTTALPIDLSNGIPMPMLLQPIYFVYGVILLGLSAWLWLRAISC